ncbi:hypothetical protein [Allonocardiopsis opalescens]|uniref:Uncharacterized protein n=1 Tax=Allonocardiopsis opalescens TaxID=1144618 RepID=A0A2T0QCV4_9ACTN|nr:hypothetical protein [Allonocardiopsis opalescens]PRY01683.1 hypothetical protein CLV72_101267 [Allonocardiopsis opalescens]
MAVLRYRAELAELPRAWFERAVAVVFETVEDLRFRDGALLAPDGSDSGVRLVAGRHIAPGARYLLPPEQAPEGAVPASAEVEVVAWDRGRESTVRLRQSSATDELAATLALRSVARPSSLRLQGRFGATGAAGPAGRLSNVAFRADADLDGWWAQAAGRALGLPRGPSAPVTASAVHRLGRADAAVSVAPGAAGTWRVEITVRLRGRSWVRPLAWALLPFFRRRIDGWIRGALVEAGRGWNRAVPELVRHGPDRQRERIAAALTSGADRGSTEG